MFDGSIDPPGHVLDGRVVDVVSREPVRLGDQVSTGTRSRIPTPPDVPLEGLAGAGRPVVERVDDGVQAAVETELLEQPSVVRDRLGLLVGRELAQVRGVHPDGFLDDGARELGADLVSVRLGREQPVDVHHLRLVAGVDGVDAHHARIPPPIEDVEKSRLVALAFGVVDVDQQVCLPGVRNGPEIVDPDGLGRSPGIDADLDDPAGVYLVRARVGEPEVDPQPLRRLREHRRRGGVGPEDEHVPVDVAEPQIDVPREPVEIRRHAERDREITPREIHGRDRSPVESPVELAVVVALAEFDRSIPTVDVVGDQLHRRAKRRRPLGLVGQERLVERLDRRPDGGAALTPGVLVEFVALVVVAVLVVLVIVTVLGVVLGVTVAVLGVVARSVVGISAAGTAGDRQSRARADRREETAPRYVRFPHARYRGCGSSSFTGAYRFRGRPARSFTGAYRSRNRIDRVVHVGLPRRLRAGRY